jgi:hypothetical protein
MLWPGQENTISKQLFDFEIKGQGPTKVIMVRNTPLMVMHPHTKYHCPISKAFVGP